MQASGLYLLFLCLGLSGHTIPSANSIPWQNSWHAALEDAQNRDTIIFVAVNMDGERANDQAAASLYHHQDILDWSTQCVSLIASRFEHRSQGTCPRFGTISCQEHQAVEKEVRDKVFGVPAGTSIIAPHHVFLDKTGKILLSIPYQVSHQELAWCFYAAMKKAYPERALKESKGSRAPRRVFWDEVLTSDRSKITPLTDDEVEVVVQRLRSTKGIEQRIPDLYALLATDHPDAIEAINQALQSAKGAGAWAGRGGKNGQSRLQEFRLDLIHKMGVYSPLSYWQVLVNQLEDANANVRQEAAVALEQIGAENAIKALKASLKNEEDPNVRRCLVRALGTCGAENSSARKQLLTFAKGKKEPAVQKNALFALGNHAGQKAVGKTLQKYLDQGDIQQQQAVLLGVGFARNSQFLPVIENLSPADPAVASTLEVVLQVAHGKSAKLLAPLMKDVLGDSIPRERFFPPNREDR